jgi:hypothetical protein
VIRPRHPTDERARCVSITSKGRTIYQRLRVAFEPFLELLISDYQPEELRILQQLLRRIPPLMTARKGRRARRRTSPLREKQRNGEQVV